MPDKDKYFRTIVVIEILSEGNPIDGSDVLDYYEPAMSGPHSGAVLASNAEQIDAEQAAQLLIIQGSEPGFFGLNADDDDTDED